MSGPNDQELSVRTATMCDQSAFNLLRAALGNIRYVLQKDHVPSATGWAELMIEDINRVVDPVVGKPILGRDISSDLDRFGDVVDGQVAVGKRNAPNMNPTDLDDLPETGLANKEGGSLHA